MSGGLAAARKRFVTAVGAGAVHALQDGATLGVLFALSLTYPPAVALAAGAIGLDGLRPRKIIAQADELVRTDDIQASPEYFLAGLIAGVLGGVAVGRVLALSLPAVSL